MTTETPAVKTMKPDDMYERTYWDIQHVLDKHLGGSEKDGAGAGIVADVALLAEQRDQARKHRDAALMRIKDLDELLVCYRIGKQPSERLFKRLAASRDALIVLDDSVSTITTTEVL